MAYEPVNPVTGFTAMTFDDFPGELKITVASFLLRGARDVLEAWQREQRARVVMVIRRAVVVQPDTYSYLVAAFVRMPDNRYKVANMASCQDDPERDAQDVEWQARRMMEALR